MDLCAELTLRLLRAGQEALNPRSSDIGWVFFPEQRPVGWAEAGDRIEAVPKPAIIAALLESGWVAVSSLERLAADHRSDLEREFANQVQYFSDKLAALALTDHDFIETPDGEFRLSVAEFKRWVREYSVPPIGIGLALSPVPHTGRLLVRPPGGHQAPLGWIAPAAS